MNLKTLRKKISKLETRLQEGPAKLARWKRKLAAMEKAKAQRAKKKSATRPSVSATKAPKKKKSAVVKAADTRRPTQVPKPKTKRKLNLSPERRAQLAAAMKARWAAKRAATGTNPQSGSNDQGPSSEGSA